MRARRVLIVDDDANVSRVIARVFEKAAFEVAVAANGEQALALVREHGFDAMVTDINMPRLDGRELCRRVCDSGAIDPRCIVVVTSRTRSEERDWTRELTGVQLVEKPVPPRSLLQLVKERLADADPEFLCREEKKAA